MIGWFPTYFVKCFWLLSVECYDIRTKQWKYVASMAHARRYVAAAALDGLLYAVGGYDGFAVLDSVEVYDPRLDQWKPAANMANPRRHVAVGVLDTKDATGDGSGPGIHTRTQCCLQRKSSLCYLGL